jgi:hypothetical protein
MSQIFIGLMAEGKTDYRFLEPIVEKVLIEIVFECQGQIDIDVRVIDFDKGNNFTDSVLNASQKGHQEYGITMLIIHTDADDISSDNAYKFKIDPALSLLKKQPEETHCKNVAALVPIQETEAWMLADKSILIKQIGTRKNQVELKINGHPEKFKNPKERIEEAIRIGRSDMPKKLRDSLQVSDLYSFLGQSLQIENLRNFNSFLDFEKNVRQLLINLNFLQT